MGKIENDCVVLLCYLEGHPNAPQDFVSLEAATGIAKRDIFIMIYYPWIDNGSYDHGVWYLEKYADKYGFEIGVCHGRGGRHINVVKRNK